MYNPFTKSFTQSLDESDLNDLIRKCIPEGLYVEYKREFPPENLKVARSIASFANSHGGWYFLGIEANKIDNTPSALVGLDLVQFPDPISKLRDIIKDQVDPFPALNQRLVPLKNGRFVLVTLVSDYQDKPFVTKDGRIYRRAADSSEPVFEKDRYTIDYLYKEGRRFRKSFDRLRNEESNLSQGGPWLRAIVVPYPSVVDRSECLEVTKVAELLRRSREEFQVPVFGEDTFRTNFPFNTGYASGTSLNFRQVDPSSGHYRGTSVRMALQGGAATFELPLVTMSSDKYGAAEVRQVLDSLALDLGLLDLGSSLILLAPLVAFYLYWLGEQPLISEFRLAIALTGIADTLAVIDDPEWARHIETFGLPVVHSEKINIPFDDGWFTWTPKESQLPLWVTIASLVSYSVGIPENIFGDALEAGFRRADASDGKIVSSWQKKT